MFPPAVNIVLSYDPEAMIMFQKVGSFEEFSKYRKTRDAALEKEAVANNQTYRPNTYLFNNSPNSTFLSLEHQFGGKGGESRLEVEIIDPQGMFESAMLDNTLESQLPARLDPVAQHLNDLQQELKITTEKQRNLKKANQAMVAGQNVSISKLAKSDPTLVGIQDKIDNLKEDIKDMNMLPHTQDEKQGEIIQKQLDAHLSPLQRPVYVTYGIGNNFNDWAPVQCFANVIGVEYSFTGKGVRTLKLRFAGNSIHPNLMDGFGVSPLGSEYTQGLMAKGLSDRIFNTKAGEDLIAKFEKNYEVDAGEMSILKEKLGDPTKPSFHLVVTQAITDFIKRASNQHNVIVLMPDLDAWLAPYIKECQNNAYWRTPRPDRLPSGVHKEGTPVAGVSDYIKGFGEALEGIGLKMCEVPEGSKYNAAIGVNQYEYIEECDSVEGVQDWLDNRSFKAVIECDFAQMSFIDKLAEVGKAISGKINNLAGDENISTEFIKEPCVETDFRMIQILHKHALIASETDPVIFWGDINIRNWIMYGAILETSADEIHKENNPDSKEDAPPVTDQALLKYGKAKLAKYLSPLDVIRGFSSEYMQDVLAYQIPDETWTGPFGPMYDGENPNDLRLDQDTNQNAKRNFRQVSSRLPVFRFGSRSPNVLGIDIDINGIFLAALHSAGPVGMGNHAGAVGIIPKGFEGQALNMFDLMTSDGFLTDLDKNGVPVKFKKLMKKYYDYDWWNGDDVQDFGGWSEAFEALGGEYAGIADKSFYGSRMGSSGEPAFMKFMWKAFQALYAATHPSPLMDRKHPQKTNAAIKTITKSTQLTQKINESVLQGKITTLPMFSLSTSKRVINKGCILHCVEPRFIHTPTSNETKEQTTWFSGVYNMLGFIHKISAGNVESQFFIARSGKSGLGKNTKENMAGESSNS
tara:strand:- start:1720 stop:4470 length:2751 start_codon:yes stop_codon:yes gene_type:complete